VIAHGDCRALLEAIEDDTFDSSVTDPPYEINFMGNSWDRTGVAYDQKVWRELLRVMKPGAYIAVFGGARTYHRMACAIEDAGFRVRDQLVWLYGEGMNKGGYPSPQIDKVMGAERKVLGERTLYGSAALSAKERGGTFAVLQPGASAGKSKVVPITTAGSPEAALWEGWAYNLKPALEPICLAQKPFKGSAARNLIHHGTGALNIGACAVKGDNGTTRIPANLVLSHAEDCWIDDQFGQMCALYCPVRLLGEQSGVRPSAGNKKPTTGKGAFWGSTGRREWSVEEVSKNDAGTAARYFTRFYYSPKANHTEKTVGGQVVCHHPTVKPLRLIKWLTQLITPAGGYIVDPFVGSGTSGIAAALLGARFYGCDLKRRNVKLARARIKLGREFFSRAA
jgi:hypothetical protein